MKKNTYIKMTAPFRENNRAARKLELINKICTYLVFITYPVYVLYLCFTAGHMLALSIIAPLVGFIAVSVFRYIITDHVHTKNLICRLSFQRIPSEGLFLAGMFFLHL